MTRPWCRWEPGSLRATTKIQSDSCAHEVHVFWPSTSQWSPSSRARVWTLARSEPAFGSE
ncbi:MAG: hypothetical protein V9E93_14925 [Steroidobacteraceae bacterium]